MQIGNRYRCYPTKEQETILLRWIGCQRFIYNAKVSEDRYYRAFAQKFAGNVGQFAPIDSEYSRFIGENTQWLKQVPRQKYRHRKGQEMADAPDFMTETTHVRSKQGKPRKCCECCGPITPGQRYVTLKGVWSGDFQTFYYHVQCRAISEAQSHYLQTVGGRYQDELPAIGDMIDEAREDFSASGNLVPSYWPDGVEVSYEGLRAFVEAATAKTSPHTASHTAEETAPRVTT